MNGGKVAGTEMSPGTKTGGLKAVKKSSYPYLVTRYMATVYNEKPIRLVSSIRKPRENSTDLEIRCENSHKRNNLSTECRNATISKVKEMCKADNFRRCVVFGPEDQLFIEPDGTTKESRFGAPRVLAVVRPIPARNESR